MSNSDAYPQLSVTNFGPIQEADINLRPLTVFVGPSNTGKSYLAILIYALHSFFSSHKSSFSLRPYTEFDSFLSSLSKDEARDLNNSLINMDNLVGEVCSGYPEARNEALVPQPVETLIRKVFLKSAGIGLSNEIVRCFGLAENELSRNDVDDGFRVTFRTTPDGSSHPIEHQLRLKHEEVTFQTEIPEEMSLMFNDGIVDVSMPKWGVSSGLVPDVDSNSGANRFSLGGKRFMHVIADYFAEKIYSPFNQSAYYLPAARTGLMHAFKPVIGGILENSAMGKVRVEQNSSTVSGIVADFLQNLIIMDESSSSSKQDSWVTSEIQKICDEIEQDILEGTLEIENSTIVNNPQFSYRPSGSHKTLPLKNTSSMISELAPVIFYLRHFVDEDNLLIIEEPESHLHPSMQVALTRQLASIVNAGVRVVVTTHSEWIMEELANLVKLAKLPKSDQTRIDRGKVALESDEVGAWLFKQRQNPEGSIATQIDLDESGLYPTGFDDVAITLHNKSVKISNELVNTNGLDC